MDTNQLIDTALVSVIVPVYNVREYLHRCIDSIRAQSYQNLEIIIIDDGSTDGSQEICDELAMSDNRIVVAHKENGGPSAARNEALEIASGEYVVFVDADDCLGANHIANLFLPIDSGMRTLDIVVITGLTEVTSDTSMVSGAQVEASELNREDALCELVKMGGRFASYPCGKLFSKRIFNTLRFPVGKFYEDQFVIYKTLLAADLIFYEDAKDYYYDIERVGSTSNSSRTRRLDFLEAIRGMTEDPRLQTEKIKRVVWGRYIASLAESCVISGKYCSRDRFRQIFQELKLQRPRAVKIRTLSLKTWGVLLLSYFGEGIFRWVSKIVYR